MTADAPLEGIRILDLSRLLPGPYCSQLLSDLGADVIKVEDPNGGDYARWAKPSVPDAEPSAAAAFFIAFNRGKRSIGINLKRDEGRQAFLRLVETADVVLESFRPGAMGRLGLDPEALLARRPQLVICSISGYGQSGPLRERSGHDLNYLARAGALALSGDRDGPPTQSAVQIADLAGAMLAATGILAAVRQAERSGQGRVVDIAMTDVVLSWLAAPAASVSVSERPARRGELELGGALVCYRVYRCADGWVALGALERKFWRRFCAAIERPDLVDRQFDAPGSETHGQLEALFASRTRDEWEQLADTHDCCLEPVLELHEALASAHVRARRMLVEAQPPNAPAGIAVVASPLGRSGALGVPAVPTLAEHTFELLGEVGYGPDQIRALEDAGAVAGPDSTAAGSFLS